MPAISPLLRWLIPSSVVTMRLCQAVHLCTLTCPSQRRKGQLGYRQQERRSMDSKTLALVIFSVGCGLMAGGWGFRDGVARLISEGWCPSPAARIQYRIFRLSSVLGAVAAFIAGRWLSRTPDQWASIIIHALVAVVIGYGFARRMARVLPFLPSARGGSVAAPRVGSMNSQRLFVRIP